MRSIFTPTPPTPYALTNACLCFVFGSLLFTQLGFIMFADTDPLWHLAAGDIIRTQGFPKTDPWSYTAGDYPWLIISWAWDLTISWLYSKTGWHGPIALNAMTFSLTLSLIFYCCIIRSRYAYISLLTTFGALSMLVHTLRPLQMSYLMSIFWFMWLGHIFRAPETRLRWFALLPFMMLIWVNTHGGFIMGFFLLGAFFLQALQLNDKALLKGCMLTAVICFITCFINPYGVEIIEAVRRPLFTVANEFINEWRPFAFTEKDFAIRVFLFLYLALLPVKTPQLLPIERLIPLFWGIMSFTAIRYIGLFAVFAAPQVACAIAYVLRAKLETAPQWRYVQMASQPNTRKMVVIYSIIVALWLPTPMAERSFGKQEPKLPHLREEIAYIQQNLTNVNLLTHFNIATILTYETGGKLKVFIDPRTETAYPRQLMKDYTAFHLGKSGWEQVLKDYNIGAIITPNPHDEGDEDNKKLYGRLEALKNWQIAFKGPDATIFVKTSH